MKCLFVRPTLQKPCLALFVLVAVSSWYFETRLSVEDVEYLLMKCLFVRPTLQKLCLALFVLVAVSSWYFDITMFFSLQARLIEGIIDQVDGVVHVSWVQQRVLGIDQVKSLRDRLDMLTFQTNMLRPVRWSDTTLLAVEAKTPDLVSS
jgi:hypothetical protein